LLEEREPGRRRISRLKYPKDMVFKNKLFRAAVNNVIIARMNSNI
jgi:hypothetical protein